MKKQDMEAWCKRCSREWKNLKSTRKLALTIGTLAAAGAVTGVILIAKKSNKGRKKMEDETFYIIESFNDAVQEESEQLKDSAENVTNKASDKVDELQEESDNIKNDIHKKAEAVKKSVKKGFQNVKKDIGKSADELSKEVQN